MEKDSKRIKQRIFWNAINHMRKQQHYGITSIAIDLCKAHYGITIDIEAINELHFLAVAIVVSKHPGNKIVDKRLFCFPTYKWKGQTAAEFWSDPLQKTLRKEIQRLSLIDQEILKEHAGFTLKSLLFWIKHLTTLSELAMNAKERSQTESFEVHQQGLYQDIHDFLENCLSYSNVVYLTDNPAYDVGFLDCLLLQRGLTSLRGNYVECKHIYSMAEGLLGKSYRFKSRMIRDLAEKYKLTITGKPMSHHPIDDCLYVTQVYEALLCAFSYPQHSTQIYYQDSCLYAS